MTNPHSFTTAPERRFYNYGIFDFFGGFQSLVFSFNNIEASGDNGKACLFGNLFGNPINEALRDIRVITLGAQ